MPLYEFVCLDCSDKFEELVTASAENVTCPKCGSQKTTKQFSTFASNAIKTDSCGSCQPSSKFT